MSTTALSCGNVDRAARPSGDGVRWFDLPVTPTRQDLDPLLAETAERLVVHGTDADFASVVLRLLRKNRLGDLVVGYVPVTDSPAARLWGLRAGDFERALTAAPRPSALIRDDSGGVLLGAGTIVPITGQVYCDDEQVLNGSALEITISPDPDAEPLPESTPDPMNAMLDPAMDGLLVTTVRRGLLRRRSEVTRGRAVQASFRSATVVHDGMRHPRPAEKWVWYRHTEDLQFAR
ncbi:hypothetical protein SAMN02982929_05433 [Saccharopolyspora kobensis]|uniref:Uncharacterized protein n=1 Tax=Saccharopolyspora kobensis TaxID=146035 RepID=A0A1H6E180_9PSEU|nr:hypothetical protein [Saccharopolyspora kobensis]SEG91322.1 hypothetical protein SAMN02982929_05433 [Saccharopolyspora kobensis]SFF14853.1 hypothetical protein SAMN05216506_12069 [Saccharopolyspora kobensis]